MLEADIADMQTLLESWETAPESDRRLWEAEWPAVAAMLDMLCHLRRDDALTDGQCHSLTMLIERVQSLAPTLRQHGFAVPTAC
jgi:hypothetical protein